MRLAPYTTFLSSDQTRHGLGSFSDSAPPVMSRPTPGPDQSRRRCARICASRARIGWRATARGGQGQRLRPRSADAFCRRLATPTALRCSSSTPRFRCVSITTRAASFCWKGFFAADELPEIASRRLAVVVHHIATRAHAGDHDAARARSEVFIKINTGMNRLRLQARGSARDRRSPVGSARASQRCA